jgi:DNA-binding transcriptional MerR regulator
MAARLTIGRIAAAAGCKVQTVRYYEQIGLLPRPARSEGNQRLYGKADVDRLMFIRHARELGFPLQAIRDLLGLSDRPEQSCAAVDAIARAQLAAVEQRIARLQALERELQRMIEECSGGRIAECRVIEVLGDHALCETGDHQHGAPPTHRADAPRAQGR